MSKLKYNMLYKINKLLSKYACFDLLKLFFEKKASYYLEKSEPKKHAFIQNYSDSELEKINFFCKENSKYWTSSAYSENNGIILSEGFFAEAGPNYVIRVGTITKALEEKYHIPSVFLLKGFLEEEEFKRHIWSSFGFNNFISVMQDIYPHLSRFRIRFYTYYYFYLLKILVYFKKFEKIRFLSHNGVRFGDLFYDEIIKIDKDNSHSFTKVTKTEFKFLKETFKTYEYMRVLYSKYPVRFFVTTHTQYISYGLPARYLKSKGVPIIETTDDRLFIYMDSDDKHIFKFHDYSNRAIKSVYETIYNNNELIDEAKAMLDTRFNGKLEQIDAKLAFSDKKMYSTDRLRKSLGITNEYPFVFILAHVFHDAPCGLSDFQIFSDYFQWLDKTVKYCSKLSGVNWVIKEHPSVDAYNERGEVQKLVSKYKRADNTIYVCPDDFSTASLVHIAKAIITAQGTAGIEFASQGIPPVITSSPFYVGFGFTVEPKTEEEYYTVLRHITELKPLNDEQKRMALAVYKSFMMLHNTDFSIIDTQVKGLVWGAGTVQDIPEAFYLVGKRLQHINPKESVLYKNILERC